MINQKRDLVSVFFLLLFTGGLYYIYWTVKTKNALKSLGGEIPTAFLIIIPFANFYFWYKYSIAFAKYIKNSDDYIGYFALNALLPIVAIFIIQNDFNKFEK